MEVADALDELSTVCVCGNKAHFNARKVDGEFTNEGEEITIDGTHQVEYNALCGKCYIEKVLKKIKK